MSFHCSSWPVAKKAHLCGECGQRIEPGTKYLKAAGINVDGDFGVWKAHVECDAANKALSADADLGWDEYVSLSEFVDEMPPDAALFVKIHVAALEGLEKNQ